MIFGRKFHLQTDHAPLLRIFGSLKAIPVNTANRLQRWALTLLLYDFVIEHVPTHKFGHADVLSRLIDNHAKPEEDYVIACLILEEDIRVVERDSQSDPKLQKVYRYLQDGWPQKCTIADAELLRYHGCQESLSTVDGCILFGERLVIPEKHRGRCLRQLHQGHPGIKLKKAIARSVVYWLSLDDEIVAYVNSCKHCASVVKSPPHSPPVPWPKPTGPWKRVHIDYAGPIDRDYFLLAVDAYSKWTEIVQTRRITSAATISILRSLFARLGMPEVVVSDNPTNN
ncbi:uncharacterized protein K02A2.6-like [Ochlerotatus camptorhynchus]|uniref:uncharacterized protein K02A2.6-like n=1 Tax=Ochlerotatus camptorhynchus TaxID=644619 RepID=UPI0031D21B69